MNLAHYPLLRCLALYRATPWRFSLVTLLFIAVNLSLAWQQWLVGRAVNDVERGVAVVALPGGGFDASVAIRWLIILGSVAFVRAIVQYGTGILALIIQQILLSTLRDKIFERVQGLDLAYHWEHGAGELVTRTTRDGDKLRDALISFWRQIVDALLTVAACMLFLFWYHPLLGLVPFLLTLAGIGMLFLQAERLVVLDRSVGDAYDAVNQDLTEGVHGVRVIKAFSLEQVRINQFAKQVQFFVDQAIEALAYASTRIPIPQMVVAFGQVWVLGFGVYLLTHGKLNLGELIAALLIINILVFRIEGIGRVIKVVADARASAARIWELLDSPTHILSGDKPVPQGALGVKLDSVSVYPPGGGNPVLEDLSLQIAPGEVVALVGATGSGKSTLASLLPRLADPSSGEILLGSDTAGWQRLRDYQLDGLRKRVHVVPQESFLFSDTLAANLRVVAPDASDDDLHWALHMAAADEILARLPNGLQTRLGDRGATLSGGQRQRVCLARALLAKPALLVLDDSTSALDAVTERTIFENIRRMGACRTQDFAGEQAGERGQFRPILRRIVGLCNEKSVENGPFLPLASRERPESDRLPNQESGQPTSVLLIASKLSSILLANRVALLAGGQIVAAGRHEDLLQSSAAYRELLGFDEDIPHASPSAQPILTTRSA